MNAHPLTNLGKGLVAFALLMLAGSAGDALAQGPIDVETRADVNGGSIAPHIECKWELPDMQWGITNPGSYPDPQVQYRPSDGSPVYDDEMGQVPSPAFPCAGPPLENPEQFDGATHVVQVKPLPENDPEERLIQLWAAVDHPNGISNISDVYWKIFHPDGSFKLQVHGIRVPGGPSGFCGSLGPMWEAAIGTQQLTHAAAHDIDNGMVAKCFESEKALYWAPFPISKDQMCGEYRIEAHAVSQGVEDVLVNYLDIMCFIHMRTDFTQANWGTVTPGLVDIVSGDLNFGAGGPTVRNVGNDGMGLNIQFSRMRQHQCGEFGCSLVPGFKWVDQFDACFGRAPSLLQCIDPIFEDTLVLFDSDPARILCANHEGKLDLSIHPPSTLPNGTYIGTVQLIGRTHPNFCLGNQYPTVTPGPTPSPTPAGPF
jgi:hypothetical protein